MAIQGLDYWYDGQQRRFLEQVIRAFSGFQYQTGRRGSLAPQLVMVPCRMATRNRMVAHIMQNLSENTLLTVPLLTVWQDSLRGRRGDVQFPGLVETIQVTERDLNSTATAYGTDQGNSYSVQRLMARPFEMGIRVDLWTSNLDQKHQILEQILPIIYPTFDIQNSTNPIDWTALTTMLVEDITWTSTSIPVGTENEIDVASISLRLPIWLSPPARVTAQRMITQIIANIYQSTDGDDGVTDGALLSQVIVTPEDAQIGVAGSTITLLASEASPTPDWRALLAQYGTYRAGQSLIKVVPGNAIAGAAIAGTITLDPSHPERLTWQIDPATLPANTETAIKAVIDPRQTFPGQGLNSVGTGDRYLILADIAPSLSWGNITAHAQDIIQYTGSAWEVAFVASHHSSSTAYVLNQFTTSQLHWTGQRWVLAIDGTYRPGFWHLAL